MERKDFWSGFAAGAATSLGALWIFGLVGRGGRSRIVRIEKSIQIGVPVEDVFETWSNLDTLPRFTSLLRNVRRQGDRSHWVAEIAGRPVEWDAEVTQVIPNQSIGWKSVSGTRHVGRVTFSELGGQTLVHVQMNYAPQPWFVRPLVSSLVGKLESYIEQGLRDVKSALESRAGKPGHQGFREPSQATGTYGPTGSNPRFGSPTIPVEFTRPPEAKS